MLSTLIFLRPINKAVAAGGDAVLQSDGYKHMQQTKWMTLTGSTLSVTSSTLFYVIFALQMAVGGIFWSSPWLNVFVFGLACDSVLNDVGVLFVSGVMKNVSVAACRRKWKKLTTAAAPSAPVAPQPLNFDSDVSADYSPDEVRAVGAPSS